MQQVKKVEVIISTLELNEVIEILNIVRVSGYTILKNVSGKGERGISNDDLDGVLSNSYIMTICNNQKQLDDLVAKITPLLKKVGGVCLVTDVNWIEH